MHRRRFLLATFAPAVVASAARAAPAATRRGVMTFPRDFGAHPQTRTEWWYITGSLESGARTWGFQITFFRVATGLAANRTSRFAATELVFAHAALSDLAEQRLRHDDRIARSGFGVAAADDDTRVVLRDWSLARAEAAGSSRYTARLASGAANFGFDLTVQATQPVLLQGIGGLSQKGPQPSQSSHYYSEPQTAVEGTLMLDGKPVPVQGRAWLDHEWSNSLLGDEAVGWDWIGMNLEDGAALTAFRLRRGDGSTLHGGGSYRRGGESEARNFASAEVAFEPGRRWTSTRSGASYPVDWTVQTPAGRFRVKPLFDDQELDSRASTGAIYWEGLSELLDAAGRRVGRGYLEMTGYAAPLAR